MRQVTSGPTAKAQQPPVLVPASKAPVAQQTIAAPLTAADVAALRARRTELSSQLNSAEGRRERLAEQSLEAVGPSRAGLEQRMAQLDERILQLEADIAATGRQLSSVPGELVASTQAPLVMGGMLTSNQLTGVAIVGTLFVLAPLAIGAARLMWKRALAPKTPALPSEVERRMERIELAVDTIAVEIERVSEGQRFVTQLMSRTAEPLPALGEGEDREETSRARSADELRLPRA